MVGDDDGFCLYNASAVGQFGALLATDLFGGIPVGGFVRELICRVFNYMTVDLLSCSPDAVCFLFVYSRFQIFIAVFIMQAAQE